MFHLCNDEYFRNALALVKEKKEEKNGGYWVSTASSVKNGAIQHGGAAAVASRCAAAIQYGGLVAAPGESCWDHDKPHATTTTASPSPTTSASTTRWTIHHHWSEVFQKQFLGELILKIYSYWLNVLESVVQLNYIFWSLTSLWAFLSVGWLGGRLGCLSWFPIMASSKKKGNENLLCATYLSTYHKHTYLTTSLPTYLPTSLPPYQDLQLVPLYDAKDMYAVPYYLQYQSIYYISHLSSLFTSLWIFLAASPPIIWSPT